MEVNITALAATISALGVIFGLVFAVYKWFLKQEKQDKDIRAIKEEQAILTEGILACLKGLKEQGRSGRLSGEQFRSGAFFRPGRLRRLR